MGIPIIQEDLGLIQGIQQAGGALGQALQSRAQNQLEAQKTKRSGTILNDVLSKMPSSPTMTDFQSAMTEYMQRGGSPELLKPYAELYKPIFQEQAKAQGAQSYLNNLFGLGGGPQEAPATSPTAMASPGGGQVTGIEAVSEAMRNPATQETFEEGTFDITTVPESSLMKLLMSPYGAHQRLAEGEIKRRENEQKKFFEERKYHQKGAQKAIDEASKLRKSLRLKENALALGRQAIESGETGPISWANIASKLGLKEFMNAAGTQLNQAGKEFFFGNMSRVSARAQNLWIEQLITKLAAEVGDPKINALIKTTMLEAEDKMDKAYLESFDRLADQDLKEHGFVKSNIEQRAFKESEEMANEIMNEVSFKTRQLYEQEKGPLKLQEKMMEKVPKGTYLTPQMAKLFMQKYGDYRKGIENAEKLGYTIPTAEQYKKWL